MSHKGIFSTPRTLGQVSEIVSLFIQVKRLEQGGDYIIVANMAEGEEQQDGRFTAHVEKTFQVNMKSLSTTDKATLNKFLSLVVKDYTVQEGYTEITIN